MCQAWLKIVNYPEQSACKDGGNSEFYLRRSLRSLGVSFVVINRWEPTSQICSECGLKWGKLELKVRTVTCLNCGATHDRDENAAKNIKKVGIGHCHDSKQTGSDRKTSNG